MHWILSVSETFSLKNVLLSSRWLLLPPFSANAALERLYRVERLETGHTVALTFSETPAGLIIHSNQRLVGKETEEISHKTWRMLRLSENLQPFHEQAQRHNALIPLAQTGARLLRGANFFEDVIKGLLLTWKTEAWGAEQIHWLVDRFGDPLPTNPTRHAFPTPEQFLWNEHLLREMPAPALALQLIKVAESFLLQAETIQRAIQPELPTGEVVATLQNLLALDARALGFVMFSLGRYDHIPDSDGAATDDRTALPPIADIRESFPDWSRWGGLICWLRYGIAQAHSPVLLQSEV